MFQNLPAPARRSLEGVHAQCVEMRDFVVKIRNHTAMQYSAPLVKGLPAGSQPLLNWKLYEFAAHRRDSDPADLRNDTDPPPEVPAIPKYPGLHAEAAPRWAALTAKARAADLDLIACRGGLSAAAMKPAFHSASLRSSRTASMSRSAAATSPTIPRTRDAC